VPDTSEPPDRPLVATWRMAELLDVSPSTLYRWVRAGWIEPDARTPGGQMRWDPDRVELAMTAKWRERRGPW
jgi:predicted site-specific integrase-resolvase